MLVDTHCHLHFPEFDADRAAVQARAAAVGVGHCVTIGTNLATSRQAVEIARRTPGVSATVGWHPHDAAAWQEAAWESLQTLSGDPVVVAIGEVGLDYYRDLSPRPAQRAVFRRMIGLARERGLPLVLHSRSAGAPGVVPSADVVLRDPRQGTSASSDSHEAHDDLLTVLSEEWPAPIRGVMHCFSGDAALARRCVEMGLYISFACNLLYKSSDALREAAVVVPSDRLLTETDAPFLPPPDRRGARNEPAAVRAVAEGLAALRGVSVEAIADCAWRNAVTLFGRRLEASSLSDAPSRAIG